MPLFGRHFNPRKPTMPNYFFNDSDGIKRGPLTIERLQTLIDRGVITPTTPLETDTGHTGLAGQIPGLNFNTAVPLPIASRPPRTGGTYTQQNGNSVSGSIISWLLDFAFRDLRLPVINRWACRIIYVICCVGAILWGLFATFMFISIATGEYGDASAIVIGIPLVWLGVVVFIFLARLFCEWYIIVFDWIVETTRAARKYNDE